MKKNKYLIFVSILLIIIFVVLIVLKLTKKESTEYDQLDIEIVLEEINLATDYKFQEVVENRITSYMPLSISDFEKIVFATYVEDDSQYFIIGENLSIDEKNQIKLFSSSKEQNTIFYSDEDYVYLIKCDEYSEIIKGIIDSFINYKKSKK